MIISPRSRARIFAIAESRSSRGKLNRNFRPAAAKRRGMYIKQQYLKHNRLFHQRLVSVPTPSHSSEHLNCAFLLPSLSLSSHFIYPTFPLGLSRTTPGLFSLQLGLSFRLLANSSPPFSAYVNGTALQLTLLSTSFYSHRLPRLAERVSTRTFFLSFPQIFDIHSILPV